MFYICISILGIIYSSYVIYVFCGGVHRILPLSDKELFRSADMVPFVFLGGLFLVHKIFKNKNPK